MSLWNSLYWSGEAGSEALTQRLQQALTQHAYTLYNPFGLIPGRSYPVTLKLFLGPASGGWRRLLAEATQPADLAAVAAALSQDGLCLWLGLDGTGGRTVVYSGGQPADPAQALLPHCAPGRTAADLQAALEGRAPTSAEAAAPAVAMVPLDALPPELHEQARALDEGQIGRMFDKISKNMLPEGAPAGAHALLQGQGPDWNSEGGRRIRALVSCLALPADWREPDFVTLRTAYQLHARRKRSPQARLYPGDAEAMAAVPDALDYTPIYGGREV